MRRLMNALLFFPAREILQTPPVPYGDVAIGRLHGWWVPATAPLLVLHGSEDPIVPLVDGEALFEAAPEPKRLEVFDGVGHNDVLARAGNQWIETIAGSADAPAR